MYAFTDIITKNGKIVGYMVQGEGKENKKYLRLEEAVRFVKEKEVVNAMLGLRQGTLFIKGKNCNLKETLPSITLNHAITTGLIKNFDGIDIQVESKKIITKFKGLPADNEKKLSKVKELFDNEKVICLNVDTKNGEKVFVCSSDVNILNDTCNSELQVSRFKDVDFAKVKETVFFPNDKEIRVLDLRTKNFVKIPLAKINSYALYLNNDYVNSIVSLDNLKRVLKANRFVEVIYLTKGKKVKKIYCTLDNYTIKSTGCGISKIDSLQGKDENGLAIVFDHSVNDWRALHVRGILAIIESVDSKLTVETVDNIFKTKVRLVIQYMDDSNKLALMYGTIQPELFKNSNKTVYDFINEYKTKKDNNTFLLYDLGEHTFRDIAFNKIVSAKSLQSNVKIMNTNRKVSGR